MKFPFLLLLALFGATSFSFPQTQTQPQTTSSNPLQAVPTSDFDYRSVSRKYLHDTFSPTAIAETTSASSFGLLGDYLRTRSFHPSLTDSIERHFYDKMLRNSVEFGFSVALKQDVAFKKCLSCTTFRERFGYALERSFIITGYDGKQEIAFPRLINAFGTPFLESMYEPGGRGPVNHLHRSESILAWYVARSFYREFGEPLRRYQQKITAKFRR